MRAIVCTAYGPPEVLKLVDVEPPRPKKNEVRIRIFATSVTASDIVVRRLKPTSPRAILGRLLVGIRAPRRRIFGLVLAGEIDSIGAGVRGFKERDQVFGFTGFSGGGYAELACLPEDGFLAARPVNLSYEEAAAIPYGGLLAMQSLRKAGLHEGQRILIYGASGAIGSAAVQLAVRHFGAEVTGVCSAANLELVKSLGAASVIDYTRENFTTGGRRYDVIYDAVGKRKSAGAFTNARQALAPGGVVISIDDGLARPLKADMSLLKRLSESGDLRPVIDRTYRLDEMVEAHRYVEQGHKRGNVIVSVLDRPSA